MDKYVEYPGQFEPADLTNAYDLLEYCMRHNIVIELDRLPGTNMIGDMMIVKCKELSKYETE